MTDITEEMNQFRQALVALVPVMDLANIGWKDNEQYDSFDGIVTALFKAFVQDALAERDDSIIDLDQYTYDFPPYVAPSGAKVCVYNALRGGKFARLATREAAFDTAVCIPSTGEELDLSFSESRFHVGLPDPEGG